jgi:HK97 family phage major capsid protein
MDRAFSLGQSFRRDAATQALVVDMAFASEQPYERWWGVEVLQMKGARLDRLNTGDGGPLLFNHDWNDLRGRHLPGTVRADKDGVLRGQVEIPAATQATRDAAALVESRTLTKASVGYQIHGVVEQTTSRSGERIEREIDGRTFERLLRDHRLVRDGREVGGDLAAFRRDLDAAAGPMERAEDAPPVYLVIDWEPLENSLVTVPADNTVGVGRALERAAEVSQPAAPAASERKTMTVETNAAAGANAESLPAQVRQGPSAMDIEKARVRSIENLCKANKIDDNIRDHWVGTGLPVEAITEDLLKIIEERGKRNPQESSRLGLSAKEAQRFSLFRAIQATDRKDWTQAGFELECTREIAKRLGRNNVEPNRFFVPMEVQERKVPMAGRRDLTVGTTTAGGFLVETQNQSFIEVLRNRTVATRMGARVLSGLDGNVTVPRQTGAATAVWMANEASTLTESQQTFAQLALSPKTVGAYTEVSRQLMLQSSPAAEGIVTSDLAAVCAIAYDLAVLSGSGASGQPTGITNTAGIGSVSGTSIAYAGILEFQTDVAGANVMPAAGGYVTTPTVAALLMGRVKFSSTASPLWEGNVWDGTMSGFPAMTSLQMAAGTMLFGDWSQVLIGEWGTLEIEVNPYANFQSAITGIRAIVSMDCGLRYAGAFSLASSIT